MTDEARFSDEDRLPRRGALKFLALGALAAGLAPRGIQRMLAAQRLSSVDITTLMMGTRVDMRAVCVDRDHGRLALQSAIDRMQSLVAILDHRRPSSPLARLNAEGELANAPAELREQIRLACEVGRLSGGAFDISIKPILDRLRLGLGIDRTALHLVDYQQVQIRGSRLNLGSPGMQLTLDGIAKGYIIEQGLKALEGRGFTCALVEAGGDLMAKGTSPEGSAWRIGIQHPRRSAGILRTLPISEAAVATSGDYLYSFTRDHRQNHILDPRSGFSPAELSSATVVAPHAALADALSTAVMVMGREDGLALIERLPGVEALLVTKDMDISISSGFPTENEWQERSAS